MSYAIIADTVLAEMRPVVLARWNAGELKLWGGVLRVNKGLKHAGTVVAHLRELGVPNPTTLSGPISALTGLSQVAAAASVINLGVSVAGFALMLHKLGKIERAISDLDAVVRSQHAETSGRLDTISEQLIEVRYLQAQQGEVLREAVSQIHLVRRENSFGWIARLRGELEMLSRESSLSALQTELAQRTFREARHFFALTLGEAPLRREHPLDWLDVLLRYRGWCFAVTAEVQLLRRLEKDRDAAEIARNAAQTARSWVSGWAASLAPTDQFHGVFRFAHQGFAFITNERLDRLIRLQTGSERDGIDPLELVAAAEVSREAPTLDEHWWKRELGIAEVLDFGEETAERLEALASEMTWCAERGLSWSEWEALPCPAGATGVGLIVIEGNR